LPLKTQLNDTLIRKAIKMDEKIERTPDGLYTFDDQSPEDAINLLKGDCEVQEAMKEKSKRHSPDCTCTWCQQDCKEIITKLLTPEIPQKEGKVDPEVYVFADQTKEQVKKLIDKANKPNLLTKCFMPGCGLCDESANQAFAEMMQSQKQAEADYPTCAGCPLVGEDAPYDEQPDIRKCQKETEFSEEYLNDLQHLAGVDESEDICQLGPLWRKLSGVRPKEHVYEDKTIDNLLDKIIVALEKALPEMDFAWSDDRCYNQVLLVNNAKTRFSTDPLIAAYEAVKMLTGKEDAEEVIVSVIKKKVCSLFI